MKIAQQYEELLILRKELDERLKDLDFQKIKDLMLWLAQSKEYQKLKKKENQMIMLDCFCGIWLEEKRQLEPLGIKEDIFSGINSLADIEYKYQAIKYCALRLENGVPEEYCEQAIDELIDMKMSGIALGKIIVFETAQRQWNIVKMAQWLKRKQQLMVAIILLQYGQKMYEDNQDILLELADCWLEGQQWKQAYDCLKEIKSPDASVTELMKELEKVI